MPSKEAILNFLPPEGTEKDRPITRLERHMKNGIRFGFGRLSPEQVQTVMQTTLEALGTDGDRRIMKEYVVNHRQHQYLPAVMHKANAQPDADYIAYDTSITTAQNIKKGRIGYKHVARGFAHAVAEVAAQTVANPTYLSLSQFVAWRRAKRIAKDTMFAVARNNEQRPTK